MTPHDIIRIVVDVTELERSAIFTKSRKQELVKARQLMAYFIFENFKKKMTIEKMAEYINNCNHATILHSKKQIKNVKWQKWQPYFTWEQEIREKIKAIYFNNINVKICKYSQVFKI